MSVHTPRLKSEKPGGWYVAVNSRGEYIVNPFGDTLPATLHLHRCWQHERIQNWVCLRDNCSFSRHVSPCPSCLTQLMTIAQLENTNG